MLFFHRPCDVKNCGTETWVTPRLPATIAVDPPNFTVTVNATYATDVPLTKNHQPDKGAILTETIDVKDIFYLTRTP